jgi:8-oxo-dGTP diphosphatase
LRKFPPNQGKWALPGGLVELGEKPWEAAVREVREETGLTVRIEGLLDVGTDLHRDSSSKVEYNYVLVDYLARPVRGKLKLNPESADYSWFSSDEAGKLDMSRGTREVLRTYFARRPNPSITHTRRPTGSRPS